MKLWYALLFIIALILFFPYIRCFIKRLKCAVKIQKRCKQKGYKIYPTHPIWFLGHKNSKKTDLYIETPNQIFSIKLFGVRRRYCQLIIKDNGEYFIRNSINLLSWGGSIYYPIDSKHKPMPLYDFRYKYKNDWEIKTPRNILLVNPVSMEFRHSPDHGSERILGAGEIVNGMEIHSLPTLLADLENAL